MIHTRLTILGLMTGKRWGGALHRPRSFSKLHQLLARTQQRSSRIHLWQPSRNHLTSQNRLEMLHPHNNFSILLRWIGSLRVQYPGIARDGQIAIIAMVNGRSNSLSMTMLWMMTSSWGLLPIRQMPLKWKNKRRHLSSSNLNSKKIVWWPMLVALERRHRKRKR